ncbi:MAG: PAS domain S-box protein [Gammaproteobacteria bacterium]|nr:PAS domain S-box protein [Gammaproteobacteria bacterium]
MAATHSIPGDALTAAALETTPDPVLVVSREGRLLHVNGAAAQALQLEGEPAECVLTEHLRAEGTASWAHLCRQAADGMRWRLILSLGRLDAGRRYEGYASPLATPGLPAAFVLSCRERAQESIVEGEVGDLARARLAAIVTSCDDAIVGKTLDGIITDWNHGAVRLFGYTAAEAIGQSILLIVPAERRAEEALILGRLQQGERIEHFETQRLTKQGELIDVSITVSPIRDAQGRIVGASKVARDISDRLLMREAQARLVEAERAAREHAEANNLLKDEFLSVLSHELRTPLSVIQAWGHLLAGGKASAAEMPKAGAVILRNATLQKAVIDDLLDANRIVSGTLTLDLQPINPLPTVHAAVESMADAAAAKGIRLQAQLDVPDVVLRADAQRLQQVVANLLSNAVKFTPFRGEIRVKMARADSQLRLTVEDDGVGIGAAFMPRVFERFSQEDASTTRRQTGLGLGLAIAHHIVALHGGTLQAHSAGKGCGTTFTLTLPLASEPARVPAIAPAATAENADLKGLSVLVVDDEPDARQLMSRILNESGAAVQAADSATTAIEIIRAQAPHVLISDISMPGVDGYELLRLVRSLEGPGAQLPAIALTAMARPSDRLHALHAGYMAHLVKPADPCQLVATVAHAARAARLRH